MLRITKYHLLLQRYLKLLDIDSFAHTQVNEALELMKQVNNQINKNMPDNNSATYYSSSPDSTKSNSSTNSESNSNQIYSTFNIQNLINIYGAILKQVTINQKLS